MSRYVSSYLEHNRRRDDGIGNVTHLLGGLAAGIVIGLGIAGYALTDGRSMTQVKYDYGACRTIAGDLGDVNLDGWKSATKTPEGRWCVR